MDDPQRSTPRFPVDHHDLVQQALLSKLQQEQIAMGFCSLSNGGDMLFAETLLKQRSLVQAVLPFDPFQFLAESVNPVGEDDLGWQQRFTKLLEDKSGSLYLWYAGRGIIDPVQVGTYYEHTNRVLFGLALLKAKELGAQLQPMALLNARAEGSNYGALHTVNVWRSKGYEVLCLDPIECEWTRLSPSSAPASASTTEGDSVLRTLLFADLKGFSRFNDVQIDVFCLQLLPRIKALLDGVEGIVELNTWGDGLFVVFEQPSQGAEAGLRLCELMAKPEVLAMWHEASLEGVPAMRVSLHSAPVRRRTNPLTGQETHWGTNINIAARIEPVTPVNQVYASVATAALLAFEDANAYHSDFVGVVPLAKAFGAQEIFRVRRRNL